MTGAASSAGKNAAHPTPRNTELELKLLVDPADLARLIDAPLIATLARNNGQVRHLTSTYYDTAAGTLAEAGISFRIRGIGRRFIATVKRAPLPGAHALTRGEWEAPATGMTADPSSLLWQLPDDIRALFDGVVLEPLFRTLVHRRTRRLNVSGADLEIAFDQGTIEAGQRTQPISEIELELKRGDQAALFEVAVRLAEIAPLRPSLSSKAERGAALARNRPPAARRAPRIQLQAGLSLDDAFRMIFRSIFAHLLCNQAAAEDMRDPEGVHQLRIALRRLRAALALVAPLGPTPTLD
ncbi:MAG: inorganic triphosphatase, partial [Acetobacteraceae bacterium]